MNLFKVGMKKWNFKSFFAINLVILLFVLVLLSIPPTEGEVIEEVISDGDNYPLVEVALPFVDDASDFNVIEQTYHSLSNEISKISGIDKNSTQFYIEHYDKGIFFGGDYDQQSTLSTFNVEVNYLSPLLWEMFFEGFKLGIMPPIMYDYENFFDLEILTINLESEDRNITFDGQSIKLFAIPSFTGIIPNRGTSNAFKIFLPMNSLAPFGDQANIEYWYYYLGIFSNLSDFQDMTKISQIEDYSKQISDVVVSIIQKYDEIERIDRLEYRLLNLINARYDKILENFTFQILELIPFIIGFEFLLLIIVNKSYLQLQERYMLLSKRGVSKRELMKDLLRASILGPALLLILIICSTLFLNISQHKVIFILTIIIPWLLFHLLTSTYLLVRNLRKIDIEISATIKSNIKTFSVQKLLIIVALIFAIITLFQLFYFPKRIGESIIYYYRLPHFVPPLVVSCATILLIIKMKYLSRLTQKFSLSRPLLALGLLNIKRNREFIISIFIIFLFIAIRLGALQTSLSYNQIYNYNIDADLQVNLENVDPQEFINATLEKNMVVSPNIKGYLPIFKQTLYINRTWMRQQDMETNMILVNNSQLAEFFSPIKLTGVNSLEPLHSTLEKGFDLKVGKQVLHIEESSILDEVVEIGMNPYTDFIISLSDYNGLGLNATDLFHPDNTKASYSHLQSYILFVKLENTDGDYEKIVSELMDSIGLKTARYTIKEQSKAIEYYENNFDYYQSSIELFKILIIITSAIMSVVVSQNILNNRAAVEELKLIKNRFGQNSLIKTNKRFIHLIIWSLLFYSLILGTFLGIFGTWQNDGYYGPGSLGMILTNFGKVLLIGVTGMITIIVVNVLWNSFINYRSKDVEN